MSFPITSLFGRLRIGQTCGIIAALNPEICQVRGRKRALKQTLSKNERMLRRMKREEKEAARKQYSFMQRIKIRRMKALLSPSEMFPGRYKIEDEETLDEKPSCNVFFQSEFRTLFHSIPEALALHRLQQQKEVYNNPNAPVKLRIELNMTTEKATKMVVPSDEIVPVPHTFKNNEKRTILAFANDQENQDIALESGAETVLAADSVKKIVKGQFRVDDYDFCVAHSNMTGLMAPLRGILRSRFPTKLNGAMGDNLVEIIEKYRNGVKVSIIGDPVYPVWGLCEPVVGMLNMADQELEENIATIIEAVCKHRNPALGPFINRVTLTLVPSQHFVTIDVSKYTPAVTEEQIEEFEQRKGKKKKAKAAAKEEQLNAEKEKEDNYLLALM